MLEGVTRAYETLQRRSKMAPMRFQVSQESCKTHEDGSKTVPGWFKTVRNTSKAMIHSIELHEIGAFTSSRDHPNRPEVSWTYLSGMWSMLWKRLWKLWASQSMYFWSCLNNPATNVFRFCLLCKDHFENEGHWGCSETIFSTCKLYNNCLFVNFLSKVKSWRNTLQNAIR